MTRRGKCIWIEAPINRVTQEQSTEKQNFRRQKNPHPELCSVALLLDIVELLRNQRCSRSAHGGHRGRDGPLGRPRRRGAPGGRALPRLVDASNGGKIKIDIFFG